MRTLITGASGLVGRKLVPRLRAANHEVFKLTRSFPKADDEIHWNGERGFDEDAISRLENFDAVIHLAGESVAGNWTEEKKRRIRDSRVIGTRVLVEALSHLKNPPRVFVAASAIGFYGNRGDEILDDASPKGAGFFPDSCEAWEIESRKAEAFGRVVILRIGVVLAKEGGALEKMLTPFQFGVGGKVGDGKQWMSWIALDDLVSLFERAISDEKFSGVYNATAPSPVTNEEFTATLGRVLHRPTFFSVPGFAVKLMFGEMGETLLLEGCRVLPKRILGSGFTYQFENLENALKTVLK